MLKHRGTCAALSLLSRLCSHCTHFVWHSEQLHATHLLFAQTNKLEQTADKGPVCSPGNCKEEDLLQQSLLQVAFSGPWPYLGMAPSRHIQQKTQHKPRTWFGTHIYRPLWANLGAFLLLGDATVASTFLHNDERISVSSPWEHCVTLKHILKNVQLNI